MHVYYNYMYCLQPHLNCTKVYVDTTIYLYRISPNMAHLDVLTLLAIVSECCGNGLTIIWLYLMVSPDNQSLCI